MSRGSVDDLPVAAPLAEYLPAYLQEDQFAPRWTAGLDDVVAPVLSVLDCLDAYIDPHTAPEDFLAWLGEWVGALLDESWDTSRIRTAVRSAVTMHRIRGTAAGLRAQFEIASGGDVEISETGGITWSDAPTPWTGEAVDPHVHIRIIVSDPQEANRAALEEIALAAKPAHLTHVIEVVGHDRLS